MIGVRFAPEYLQVLGDGGFNFCITGQCSASHYSQAIRRLLFRKSIITNAVIDNNSSSLLRDEPAGPFDLAVLLSGHNF